MIRLSSIIAELWYPPAATALGGSPAYAGKELETRFYAEDGKTVEAGVQAAEVASACGGFTSIKNDKFRAALVVVG